MDRPNIRNGEKGATFITLLVMLFVLAVFLLWAVQPASTIMQREKEEELIFRGEQICEAIREYQKDHNGAFPNYLKDLTKRGPKNVPYLRKVYKNPFDPEGKWYFLTPGSTTIRISESGKKEILPSGGMVQQSFEPHSQQSSQSQDPNIKVLPFNINGEEGQMILGVYAKYHKKAFKKYLGTDDINEWFFSPLVIKPKAPVNLNQINPQNRPPQLPTGEK